MRFERSFFAQPTLTVASELLGQTLVRRRGRSVVSGRIVEVEAYVGPEDSACHAARGRTPRNEMLFGPPGHAYVYFVYGMHWMLNVVTERDGFPAAVLIRAVEPISGVEVMRRRRKGRRDVELTSGPARLCQAFAVDRVFNGTDLVESRELYLEQGAESSAGVVRKAPRVGIDYASVKDRRAPWRYYSAESEYVSRPRPAPAASVRARRKKSRPGQSLP